MNTQDFKDNIARPVIKFEPKIKDDSKNEIHKREIQLDQERAFIHQKIYFDRVEIHFPYKPYKIQEDYMRSVVQALNYKCNALLQSPTGTGKTLSLLCASLGWLRYQRKNGSAENKMNRILFCSRTHSQLKQVMRELKFTAYKPKVCIMASRDQYCLKKDFSVLKDLELNGACKNAIKQKSCQYYNYDGDGKQQPNILDEVLDIEDLQEKGRCKKFCPYYYSRDIKDEADIILLPYNFLLQQNRFVEFQVILKDSIIIFDEAHNVLSACEEGTSYKVDQHLIEESQNELEYLENNLTPSMRTDKDDIKDARQLVTAIGNLIKYFEVEGKVQKLRDGNTGMVCPVSSLYEMIEQIGGQLLTNHQKSKKKIKYDKHQQKIKLPNGKNQQFSKSKERLSNQKQQTEQATLFNFNFKKIQSQHQEVTFKQNSKMKQGDSQIEELQNVDEKNQEKLFQKNMTMSMKKILQVSKKLSKIIIDMQTMRCQNIDFFAGFIMGICDMYEQDLQFIKGQTKKKLSDYYKFYFNKATTNYEQSSINLWCLDPSLAFQNILSEKPHSILLTSGTLHPLNSWDQELNTDFNVKFASSHVIDIQKSLVGGFVKTGPNGQQLNFSYENRSSGIKVYEELGEFLIDLCRSVPNGILVCFSSNSLMKMTQDSWNQSELNILKRMGEIKFLKFNKLFSIIQKLKDYYFEPRNNNELQYIMKQYCASSERDSKGAILFCVCRGKLSEGIDFTDKLARSVVIVGVPFPPSADTWVCTKKEYLDNLNQKENNDINFKKLNGRDWYMLNTIRALNQAIGRVIRHKDDFGSVYLCDNRFSESQFGEQISDWVRPILKKYQNYDDLIQDSINFFSEKKQTITTLDDIFKIGNEKQDTKISIKNVVQKEINNQNMSQMQDQNTHISGKDSKRKVIGTLHQTQEKGKNHQINVGQKSNVVDQIYQPSQSQSQHFTNIFLENQHNFMRLNENSNIQNTALKDKNKTLFQNSLISKQINVNFNDEKYNANMDCSRNNDSQIEKDQIYFNNLQTNIYQNDETKYSNKLKDENNNTQFDFSNIKFQNNNQQNILSNQIVSQVSDFKKQSGFQEQAIQKRKIIINESQGSVQARKSTMSVDKYSYTNSNISEESESQSRILKLKSISVSKENSIAFNDKYHSQQSQFNINKPLYKGQKDDMMNLLRGSSDDERSNSFDINHKKELNNLRQSNTNENSLSANFLNEVFRKHSLQNLNNSLINSDQQIAENGFQNITKINHNSLPDTLLKQENNQERRQKSLKITPPSNEEGNGEQKSFKLILNTRNSQNSQRNSNQFQNTQNQEKSTQQDYSEEKERRLNSFSQRVSISKMTQFNKAFLTNNQRELINFRDEDILTNNQTQLNQQSQFLYQQQQKQKSLSGCKNVQSNNKNIQDSEQKNKENVCPICYEPPKNNHKSNICHHSACYDCWKKWLGEQLTCPMCRVRCRLAYLEPFS